MLVGTPRKLVFDSRGGITVEYLTLMVVVTLGGAMAVFAIGVPLIERFRFLKLLITVPIP